MPKKKKNRLPSGSVRVQAFDYMDETGKKHYKSFTASTLTEAKALRDEWKIQKKLQSSKPAASLTVHDAIERYIQSKEGVLSGSTLRGYDSLLKSHFSGVFGNFALADLTDQDIQLWISDISKGRSPKTVANIYALFTPALAMFAPKNSLASATLPAKVQTDLYCPSDTDIKKLLQTVKDDSELEIAILLAAFGPLRLGEVCSLTTNDVQGNTVCISHNLVYGRNNQLIDKAPKTYQSYRKVVFPDFVITKIHAFHGPLVTCTPTALSHRFRKALIKSGVPHFRFHDLRHYGASIMHAMGVPDLYIQKRGGWSSNYMMRRVYVNQITEEAIRQNEKILDHFSHFAV